MGMGLILAGLSGAGEGLAKAAETAQKFDDAQALEQVRSDLELQRQKAILQAQAQAQTDMRHANAAELNAETQRLTDQATAQNAAGFYGDGGDYSAGNLSPEEIAQFAPDQSAMSDIRRKAGLNTGLISAEQGAQLDMKGDIAALKSENYKDKIATMLQIAQMKDATARDNAQLMATLKSMKLGDGENLPSNAKMVEWQVKNGMVPDTPEAKSKALADLEKGKTKDDVALQVSVFGSLAANNFGANKLSSQDLWNVAGQMVNNSRQGGNAAPAPATGKQAQKQLTYDPSTATFK